MEYRTLGGTGVRVSTHCLGAMMFGSQGNDDVDDCVRIIHAAIDGQVKFERKAEGRVHVSVVPLPAAAE